MPQSPVGFKADKLEARDPAGWNPGWKLALRWKLAAVY